MLTALIILLLVILILFGPSALPDIITLAIGLLALLIIANAIAAIFY